jgi:hypothetical protein
VVTAVSTALVVCGEVSDGRGTLTDTVVISVVVTVKNSPGNEVVTGPLISSKSASSVSLVTAVSTTCDIYGEVSGDRGTLTDTVVTSVVVTVVNSPLIGVVIG